uniref:Uncharacterized protein n=1 Tax=Skeletonema marinoi TaxID=267567 RepID=A0A7S2M3Q2_9STRA|mmetsp:Transcript_4208/g.7219  ORF Transcript_4208/g.7219 Transcript_4208/m.7219 type:complete len:1073 (+) Transcript_4208:2097-5315(+)
MNWHLWAIAVFPLLICVEGANNWAQLAGERAQNTATPYTPEQWQKNMWSGRWGHAIVVFNQSITRSYLTEEENSERAQGANPVIILLGGDDSLPNITSAMETGMTTGKLRNDVWLGELTSGSQASWQVDDRYFVDDKLLNPQLIRSQMTWREATPGRIAPATWSSGPRFSEPLSNDEWIACQESIIDKMDYTLLLPDRTFCDEPPHFCYKDMNIPGCHAQGIWKKDNMWSPRRGHGAVVANDKIVVIGGRAREYARLQNNKLVGGLGNQKRIETVQEHSTIREENVLKNDIWDSDDGVNWKLVNPGCRDPQEDVLLQTEVWSRDSSDPQNTTLVGSAGSKCYKSSECYGVAECKVLGNNTREKVCVCPMFSPRENHAVTIQHRFSVQDDDSVISQDVIYVVGGFINVKQAFCANRSCGPADGYKLAMDDAWMSSDRGVTWIQIKKAFGSSNNAYIGRGSHKAVVVEDRLMIFGGETFNPVARHTTYLNDVWQVSLPTDPCCEGCVTDTSCLPNDSDWNMLTSNAEWHERSGHTVVYEPPSSNNAFRHRVYLMGGKDATDIFSDVWMWSLDPDEEWINDIVQLETTNSSENQASDAFVSVVSPLSKLKRYHLPLVGTDGQLSKFTPHVRHSIVDQSDLDVMESVGVRTVGDLVSADLYTILKLRGFDYPGRAVTAVPNICLLREVAISLVKKCSVTAPTNSRVDDGWKTEKLQIELASKSSFCGVGDDTKPCERGDWDGCSPIPDVSVVDVFGLGDVDVPQGLHNVSSIIQETFCLQVPASRYMGAAEFIDSKVVVMGGVGHDDMILHRDSWTRDEKNPKAVITTQPRFRSPQFQFYFDSNEAGAHVFEYKIMRDETDITPWLITTKQRGVNVAWLDNKKGGPGRGWYTLYVRAVDPAGNRDALFSTQANVYRWYYVPPIPYGVVSGCIVTALLLIVAVYFEHRRRKRRAIIRKFELRRLRRKFKLKSENDTTFASTGHSGRDGPSSNSHQSSSRRRHHSRREERSNHEGSHSRSRHSHSHRSKSRSTGHARTESHVRRRKRRSAQEEEERLARRRERDKYLGEYYPNMSTRR